MEGHSNKHEGNGNQTICFGQVGIFDREIYLGKILRVRVFLENIGFYSKFNFKIGRPDSYSVDVLI